MLLLDVTVVNVALPAIESDLDASFSELQWVIDAYALTLAAALLTAGSLADRLGRRRVFVGGLVAFTVTSAACALAPSAVALDVARGAQGVAAAAMFASSLALLAHEFRGPDRGLALGVWGAVTGAALAIGPLVGGALVDGLGWESIFLLNVPIGLATAALARSQLAESSDPEPAAVDWPGLAAFTAGALLVVFGLIRGNGDGWGSARIAGSLAAGGALILVFVAVERRRRSPMLDLRLFRIPAFAGTAIVAFSQSLALYPMLLFLAIYFQDVLGYTPFETGLRVLPITIALFVVAPLSGRLTGRVPLRAPLAAGLALIGTGLLLMRAVDAGSDWTALLPGFVVAGAGVGTISPALAAAMVGVVSPERTGLASGVNNTFRQLGTAVGIAALGAIFEHRAEAGGAVTRASFVAGLDEILLVAAIVALATVPVALATIRPQDMAEG
jgi:EmrB/QacA subfamily drug resistance transporter